MQSMNINYEYKSFLELEIYNSLQLSFLDKASFACIEYEASFSLNLGNQTFYNITYILTW
jgi:hypothetical protein